MCVLRIFGAELEGDGLLQDTGLVSISVHRKGEQQSPKRAPNQTTTINVEVSAAEFFDLPTQLEDARRFLQTHARALERVRRHAGVEGMTFDFPIEQRDVAIQTDAFPADLLLAMGQLGIGLTISSYPRGT